jgi:hypothetical protein
LIGVFDVRRDAEEARDELASRGFAAGAPVDEARAEPRGDEGSNDRSATEHARSRLSALIENMFSGFVDDGRLDRYRDAAQEGRWILALRGLPAGRLDEARAVMEARGTVEVHRTQDEAARQPGTAMTMTLLGPDATALPNAPVGWGEAWRGTQSLRGATVDPARPRGLLNDAQGLDTDDVARRRTGTAPAPAGVPGAAPSRGRRQPG